jgi:hypothetical protein
VLPLGCCFHSKCPRTEKLGRRGEHRHCQQWSGYSISHLYKGTRILATFEYVLWLVLFYQLFLLKYQYNFWKAKGLFWDKGGTLGLEMRADRGGKSLVLLVEWLYRLSICLARVKPWVQTPVLLKKKKSKQASQVPADCCIEAKEKTGSGLDLHRLNLTVVPIIIPFYNTSLPICLHFPCNQLLPGLSALPSILFLYYYTTSHSSVFRVFLFH